MNDYPIPEGWTEIISGFVRIGDKTWAQSTKRFLDVDEVVLRHLEFLDALDVEDMVCVIRSQ